MGQTNVNIREILFNLEEFWTQVDSQLFLSSLPTFKMLELETSDLVSTFTF